MLNEISARINMNIKKYLPKVDNELLHFKAFKTKMDAWVESKDDEHQGKEAQDYIAQELEFKINAMQAEINHVKRIFSEEKLKQFEDTWTTCRSLSINFESLERRVSTCPSYNDLEQIEK